MKDSLEIDLQQVIKLLLKNIKLIILVTLAFGCATFLLSRYWITPKYTASISLYVDNTTDTKTGITSSDVTAAKSLVSTYVTIIQSDAVMDKVVEEIGNGYSAKDIRSMMTANSLNGTEVLQVSIEHKDPQMAANIANAISEIAPYKIAEIVSGSSVKIVDTAKVPTSQSSPNVMKNTVIGTLLGLFLICFLLLVMKFFDVVIRSESDLESTFNLPVLGAVSDFSQAEKESHGF